MINWLLVLSSAVWIGGAALALATVSYASCSPACAASACVRSAAACLPVVAAGSRLFVLCGTGLTAATGLETVLWLLLAVISAAAFISLWRKTRRNR